eukprot:SAG11_NODE_44128_length_158_cov_60.677966_1_plen_38_part_01
MIRGQHPPPIYVIYREFCSPSNICQAAARSHGAMDISR